MVPQRLGAQSVPPLSALGRIRISRTALFVASIPFTLLMVLAIDALVGLMKPPDTSLVFARHSTFSYSTPEFRTEVRINNLGFRGDDVDLRQRKRYRVIALGDSFTFGWGVDVEESWPKVLESELRRQGLDVEVLNLGAPGAFPAEYADIARLALPLLRPDLVVVAVHHADDLGQTMRAEAAAAGRSWPRAAWSAGRAALKWTYPNLAALRRRAASVAPAEREATTTWKREVAEVLSRSSPEQAAKFRRMDDTVKNMFVNGELNPAQLIFGLWRPDEIRNTLDLDQPLVGLGIRAMGDQLVKIRHSADGVGGRVVVLSLPNGLFVSRAMQESYARIGVTVQAEDLATTKMDEAVRMAAARAGVEFLGVTDRFREASKTRSLFFEFDGHYNREGHRFFAACIEAFIRSRLTAKVRAAA